MQKLIFNRVNKEKLIRDSKNEQINAKEKTYIFILDMENKKDDCFSAETCQLHGFVSKCKQITMSLNNKRGKNKIASIYGDSERKAA